MSTDEHVVRKAVFVPASLWHRVKIDAVTQSVDISAVVIDALKRYYGIADGTGQAAPAQKETPA